MASNPMGPGKLRGWVDFIAGIPVPTIFKGAVTVNGATTVNGASQLTGNVGVGGAAQTNVGVDVVSPLAAAATAIGIDELAVFTTQNAETVIGERVGGTLTLAATTATNPTGLQVNTFGGTAAAGATSTAVKGIEVIGQAPIANWTPTDVWGLFVNIATTGTNKFVAMLKGGSVGVGTITSDRPTATLHVGQVATGTTSQKVVGIAGSTVNLAEFDASAITNAQKTVVDKNGHLAISQAAAPTGVLGTGAGTGAGTAPTLTIAGTDQAGTIQVVTGTQVPAAGAAIVTVTFATAMATAPFTVQTKFANGATQALVRAQDPVEVSLSTTGWVLFAGTTALPASTTLLWSYVVL